MALVEKDYDSIIAQIKKVKALCDNGIDGEKENARVLLNKLLKKYKISLEELITEETKDYKFKFTTQYEKKILFQCLAKYAPNVNTYIKHHTKKGISKNILILKLTKLQFLDIEASTKFYVKLFAKEMELFYTAFIAKHDIYREKTDDDTENESSLTPEEISAIISMMNGMSDVSYIPNKLQIEAKK